MRANDGKTIKYQIDAEDKLVYLNEEWSAFAIANGAPNLTPKYILKRPLLDFVSDAETRELYRILFSRVRETLRPVTFPFRCDSPDLKRFMEMELIPQTDKSIQFNCTVLKVEPMPYLKLFDPKAEHSGQLLNICSWCKRIKIGSDWVEAEEAVTILDLFNSDTLPKINYGACPHCFDILMEEQRKAG